MQATVDASERLVCAVLAAQVAVIRDRSDTGAEVDLLWRTADVLAHLSSLVLELARRVPVSDQDLADQCAAAAAEEAEVSESIDALAFAQAQRHDLARQMADCVVKALARLAAAEAPHGTRLTPDELAELYVCDDQRAVHNAVSRQFDVSTSSATGSGNGVQPGAGQ